MTANKMDSIKNKVQKLLAQAEDVSGTPEATMFEQRAFELMAKYGFEQRDINSHDDNELISKVYEFSGSYTDMQALLLHLVSRSLHCSGVATTKYRSTKVYSMKVYGKRCHIERIDMLFPLLNNSMAAQAQSQKATSAYGSSTTKLRRGFMYGYAAGISRRLSDMEFSATSGTDDVESNSYSLVLLNDAEAARAAMRADHDRLTKGKGRSYDPLAANAGYEASKSADIGQTRINGMRALA